MGFARLVNLSGLNHPCHFFPAWANILAEVSFSAITIRNRRKYLLRKLTAKPVQLGWTLGSSGVQSRHPPLELQPPQSELMNELLSHCNHLPRLPALLGDTSRFPGLSINAGCRASLKCSACSWQSSCLQCKRVCNPFGGFGGSSRTAR